MIFNTVNGFPAKGFKVIGITGTNGKTTTAFLVHRMLHEAGYKVGLMTTVAYGAGLELKMPPDHYTNVPVPLMMRRLRYLKAKGVEYLVMEVTSMALAQNRLWGVPFYLSATTNISQDHLDYHGTMDRYFDAKAILFERLLAPGGVAALFVDQDEGRRMKARVRGATLGLAASAASIAARASPTRPTESRSAAR